MVCVLQGCIEYQPTKLGHKREKVKRQCKERIFPRPNLKNKL